MATVLVGNNLVNVTATVVAVHAVLRHWSLPPRAGIAVAVVLMVLVLLIVGELVPKSLFRLYPFRLSMALARPLHVCAVAMTPLTVTFEFFASAFMRLARPRTRPEGAVRDPRGTYFHRPAKAKWPASRQWNSAR